MPNPAPFVFCIDVLPVVERGRARCIGKWMADDIVASARLDNATAEMDFMRVN